MVTEILLNDESSIQPFKKHKFIRHQFYVTLNHNNLSYLIFFVTFHQLFVKHSHLFSETQAKQPVYFDHLKHIYL